MKEFIIGLMFLLVLGWMLVLGAQTPKQTFQPCVGVEKDGSFSAYCKQSIDMYQATMSGGLRIDK